MASQCQLRTLRVWVFLVIFFLLLIPICIGGDVSSADEKSAKTSSVSDSSIPIIVGCTFGGLAVGVIIAVGVYYMKKHQINDLNKKIKQLENEIKRNKENWALVQRLKNQNRELEKQRNELKVLLEKQRNELKLQLEEVKRQKEENKQKLKEVEKEIKEKELMFDKQEELLREKEKLLQEQWKLDQTKKDLDKQLLNIEKLLEILENQIPDNTANTGSFIE